MLSHDENELLTKTGPGTAMGALIRQYWIPVVQSSELEPGGRVKRVMLLGERLVAFRGKSGRAGLIGEFCPHRLASLYFGRVEESGMRCVYHGWKFGLDGQCLEMPSEPPESGFAAKVRHTAYPCEERGGVIWAYMGPVEPAAPAARSRVHAPAGSERLHLQARPGLQLVPGDGGRHRLEPHLVPPRADRPPRFRGDARHRSRELRRRSGRRDRRSRPALRGRRHGVRRGHRGAAHAARRAAGTGASPSS